MPKKNSSNMSQEKLWLSAVAYIWILFIVPLLLKRDDEFVQHHAKQGLVLFVLEVLVVIFGGLPVLGWFLILPLGSLLCVILAVLGIIHALQGDMWAMPFLSKFAKKINF
jgi:uncharacterized membrane protein